MNAETGQWLRTCLTGLISAVVLVFSSTAGAQPFTPKQQAEFKENIEYCHNIFVKDMNTVKKNE